MADSNIDKHLLDDFLTNINEPKVDEALELLDLHKIGTCAQKLARLRHRIQGKYIEDDFIVLKEGEPRRVKIRRDNALKDFLNQFTEEIAEMQEVDEHGDKITSHQDGILDSDDLTEKGSDKETVSDHERNTQTKRVDDMNVTLRNTGANSRTEKTSQSIRVELNKSTNTAAGGITQKSVQTPRSVKLTEARLASGERIDIPLEVIAFWQKRKNQDQEEENLIDDLISEQTFGLAQKLNFVPDNNNPAPKPLQPIDTHPISKKSREPARGTGVEFDWNLDYRITPPYLDNRPVAAHNQDSFPTRNTNVFHNDNLHSQQMPPSSTFQLYNPQSTTQQIPFSNIPQSTRQNSKPRDLTKIISSWNLKFSGSANENVEDFLIRIDECRLTSDVSHTELVKALPMLLDLPALSLYRVNKDKWTTWAIVEKELKFEYRDEFYSEKLEDEARARVQGENEAVRDYITAMKWIYNKMSDPPSQEKQIERIYRNMLSIFHPFMREYIKSDLNTFTERATHFDKAFRAKDAYKQPVDPTSTVITARAIQNTPTTKNEKFDTKIAAVTADDISKTIAVEVNKLRDALKSSIAAQFRNSDNKKQSNFQNFPNQNKSQNYHKSNFNNNGNQNYQKPQQNYNNSPYKNQSNYSNYQGNKNNNNNNNNSNPRFKNRNNQQQSNNNSYQNQSSQQNTQKSNYNKEKRDDMEKRRNFRILKQGESNNPNKHPNFAHSYHSCNMTDPNVNFDMVEEYRKEYENEQGKSRPNNSRGGYRGGSRGGRTFTNKNLSGNAQ